MVTIKRDSVPLLELPTGDTVNLRVITFENSESVSKSTFLITSSNDFSI